MKRDVFYRGTPGVKYGIWNASRKCWQFGICEDTPMLAEARLFQKIGDDARKWRFEPRPLPKEAWKHQGKEVHILIADETSRFGFAEKVAIDNMLAGKDGRQ